jgi:cytochrome c-type biogenesis protein CcmH/NrfG
MEIKIMKKISIVLILCFALLANCQKKEEQPVQTPMPSGPIQMNQEMQILQNAVKQDPKNIGAWIKLGNLLMDSTRYSEAIDAYEKALALDPKNVDIRVDMGTCYRRAGRADRAAEEFREAISINPLHPNAHRNLGVVLAFDLNDKKQAIKEFEEFIKLSPDTPDSQQIRNLVNELKSEPVQ